MVREMLFLDITSVFYINSSKMYTTDFPSTKATVVFVLI